MGVRAGHFFRLIRRVIGYLCGMSERTWTFRKTNQVLTVFIVAFLFDVSIYPVGNMETVHVTLHPLVTHVLCSQLELYTIHDSYNIRFVSTYFLLHTFSTYVQTNTDNNTCKLQSTRSNNKFKNLGNSSSLEYIILSILRARMRNA